jgi:photosystem II stability/assembly factor-like uncharacterized protein
MVVLTLSGLVLSSCASLSAVFLQDETPSEPESIFNSETFAGLKLRNIGPALMSGRIADIALHPDNPSIWYVAVGSGNVWKTINAGTTWTPIFENQGSYSTGCIAIDPNAPETIWLGTGENVGGRHVGFGDGVYVSRDGGKSWNNVGLGASEHIGKILIDPRDSDTVYVAAQGPLWSGGGERGLFKSTDGGGSWNLVLSGGPYTGVNDVIMDPEQPDVLYASKHQRLRTVAALLNGGPESGIFKSVDGGANWTELTSGLPSEDKGRIGLALAPEDSSIVYATIELGPRKGGFFRSMDAGQSWEKRNDYMSGGTGPHYYQEIWASPHAPGTVFQADVWMHVTRDGGETFNEVGEENKHSDNHALAFHPTDPDYLLAGCDGGLYETFDQGATWKFVANLPVTQFYKVAVDDAEPFYNVYGGTQDNSTQGGPSRTDSANGIRNADWFITVFADGHQPATEPGNPDIVYSEWQEGNLVRTDRRTGEIVYIQPQPAADEPWERFNWDAPILVSPHSPTRLYYASQRVWRSDNRGDEWTAISGDLTHGTDRLLDPMMDRVWSVDALWDLMAMSKFGTITSLAESPLVEGLLYAGTDDGRIQVSEDGGGSWRAVDSLPDVPEGFFVNDLKADLFNPDGVYACVDNHKTGDFKPYLLHSTDRGETWKSIVGDLPERHLCWRLVQDHERAELLFLGTEFGVFFSVDAGGHWVKLTGGTPNIPFRDLAIQRRENDLVGATFGRGFWILDDYSPLREVSVEVLEREAALFSVRDAHWYVPRPTLGRGGKASQGDAYFVADNPPFGAVFTYHLREDLKSRKAARQEAEGKIAEEGGDTPTPGWDALREEELASDPGIELVVRDSTGSIVRRLAGASQKGMHRVTWDLRRPAVDAWSRDSGRGDRWDDRPTGALTAPGTYTVGLRKQVEGQWTDLAEAVSFEVIPLREGSLPNAGPAAAAAFGLELEAANRRAASIRALTADLLERVTAMRSVLSRATGDVDALDARAAGIERQLQDIELAFSGSSRRDNAGDPGPVSIQRRLRVASMGTSWSTYGPAPSHRESLAIGLAGMTTLAQQLEGLRSQTLPALERDLDQAGVPWSPGRGIGK